MEQRRAMDLNEIVIFAKVAHAGSFTKAARELGMPKSTVSRKVGELEERLGARLLQRTTRQLSLSDIGRTYYEHCRRIVDEVEEAARAVTSLQEAPRGRLRITAPVNFTFLGPILGTFLKRFSDVHVELVCTDRVVGLVEEGFDVAIRAGRLVDSTLVVRTVARARSYLVASPSYLKKRGRPKSPNDLAKHDCVLFGGGADRGTWRLRRENKDITVSVAARLIANDFDVLHDAVLGGLGVALMPAHRSVAEMRSRRLERVLGEWCSPETPIHAVHPSTRHLSPTMKAFIDHFQDGMTPPPWELGPLP
jgi:DNA-binding transcriptional LysR family regulator